MPGAVVSHRSAFVGGITAANEVVLSHPTRFNRRITYPGLTLVLMKGPGPMPRDLRLGSLDLYWASQERALLENLARGAAATGRRARRLKNASLPASARTKSQASTRFGIARELVEPLGAAIEL